MYVLEQGKAPAVRTKTQGKGFVEVFRFTGRRLETSDETMVNAAVKAGAVILEAPEAEEKEEAPEDDKDEE